MAITYKEAEKAGLHSQILDLVREYLQSKSNDTDIVKADILFNPDAYFIFEETEDGIELTRKQDKD